MRISTGELPEKFIERLKIIVPSDQIDLVLGSFAQEKPCTFRANTLKISTEDLPPKLKDLKVRVQKVLWHPDAFILKSPSQRELTETEIYKNGEIYLQNLSSLIPPLVLNPKPGEKVLDLCAAPGSKTTQMASMMRNQGDIMANDKNGIRLFRLKANLKLQGVANTQITQSPGEILWRKYPEYFDKVLLDAPCSLEGRFSTLEPKSFEDWSLKKIKFLAQKQRHLLRSAVSCTRIGGVIVYATCTLAPEENEEVIDWILNKEKDCLELEEVKINGLEMSPALKEWQGQKFQEQVNRTKRILPATLMEGFFIAKIRKLKSTVFSFENRESLEFLKPSVA